MPTIKIDETRVTLIKRFVLLLTIILLSSIIGSWDHVKAADIDLPEGDSSLEASSELSGSILKNASAANWLKPLEYSSQEAAKAQSSTHTAYCRFGTNLSTLRNDATSDITNYDIASLGVGWYIDYQARGNPARPNNIDYTPMIRVHADNGAKPYAFSPNGDNLWVAVTGNIGADWFVGNEPDRKAFQDGVLPEIYAQAYNEVYRSIKNIDPTARIFAGSIVQPTEVRLEYLDEVLASYQAQFGELMPVDGWSIHNFILNEADCNAFNGDLNKCWGADMPPGSTRTEGLRIDFNADDIVQHHDINIFKTQVQNFRQWMADNGYGGKPVYLSEYGVLLPNIYDGIDFSPTVVNQFMSDTFDYMLTATDPLLGDPNDGNKLIQRFSWYSVNDDRQNGGQYNGNLFSTNNFVESEMGRNYREYTESLSRQANIHLSDVEFIPQVTAGAGTLASVPVTHTVRMTIANSGNLLEASTGYISLHDSNGELIADDIVVELAGCGEHIVIEREWMVAPADTTRFRSAVKYGLNSIYMPMIQN